MNPRRLLTGASLWTALVTGIAAGLALAVWSSPTPAFSFERALIISWRGGGDSVPAGAVSVGWSGPMFYATAEEGAIPEGEPGRHPTGQWAPGDSFTRVLMIKNVDAEADVRVDWLQMDLRGDALLAPVLALEVKNQEGTLVYAGHLSDFADGSPLPLAQPVLLRRGGQQQLAFTVSLDRAVGNDYQGRSLQADLMVVASEVIPPITIDVHPNSWPNPINPKSSGDIPVAVNGSATLNVASLDWTTARFGPNQAAPLRWSHEDWNKDGHMDLLLKFDNQASGFTCGMTEATLTITTFSGETYEDWDPIVTPACP